MTEPNLLLQALIERAGLSHAGLAKRLNDAGGPLELRYDHASVARWIRDHAIPRDPVPDLICAVIGQRLRIDLTRLDIGMVPGHAADRQPTLAQAVDRAAALWRGDARGRIPTSTVVGAQAAAPVWEWENPPDGEDVARPGDRRVDPVDVVRLRLARTHYQEMYRRVGGVPVRPRIVAMLDQHVAPLLRRAYDNELGRRLFRAAGALAALAGVCAYDADEQPLAQAHLFTALRLAKASSDREFGAYVVAAFATASIKSCKLCSRTLVTRWSQASLNEPTNTHT